MPSLFVLAVLLFLVSAASTALWAVARRRAPRAADDRPTQVRATVGPQTSLPPVPPTQSDAPVKARSSRRGPRPAAPARPATGPSGSAVAATFAIGSLVLALVATFFSSATIVSTKNVGIETAFGRPVGSMSNGFHLVAPWDVVTEMDAAIQTDNHVKDGSGLSCITVRIAHQATACVDTSIRWRIEESAADSLFRDYRDFTNVRDSLVTRDLNAALNGAFEKYDPLAIDAAGNSTSPTLESLSRQVLAQMKAEIREQINVLSVIIPVVHYDDNTQQKVNALLAQVAQTRIAEQSVITAEQQALANRTLAESVSKDPNVLVSKCVDLLGEMVSKGQVIPIGFSCWPGGGSAVVVPGVAA